MAYSARPGPVRRALARLVPDGAAPGSSARANAAPDVRLPEQRLLDVAARYGRQAVGEHPPSNGKSAAAAGVKVVPPTDPSEAGAPAWVRRLGDRAAAADPVHVTADGTGDPSAAHRGPRPHPG